MSQALAQLHGRKHRCRMMLMSRAGDMGPGSGTQPSQGTSRSRTVHVCPVRRRATSGMGICGNAHMLSDQIRAVF